MIVQATSTRAGVQCQNLLLLLCSMGFGAVCAGCARGAGTQAADLGDWRMSLIRNHHTEGPK